MSGSPKNSNGSYLPAIGGAQFPRPKSSSTNDADAVPLSLPAISVSPFGASPTSKHSGLTRKDYKSDIEYLYAWADANDVERSSDTDVDTPYDALSTGIVSPNPNQASRFAFAASADPKRPQGSSDDALRYDRVKRNSRSTGSTVSAPSTSTDNTPTKATSTLEETRGVAVAAIAPATTLPPIYPTRPAEPRIPSTTPRPRFRISDTTMEYGEQKELNERQFHSLYHLWDMSVDYKVTKDKYDELEKKISSVDELRDYFRENKIYDGTPIYFAMDGGIVKDDSKISLPFKFMYNICNNVVNSKEIPDADKLRIVQDVVEKFKFIQDSEEAGPNDFYGRAEEIRLTMKNFQDIKSEHNDTFRRCGKLALVTLAFDKTFCGIAKTFKAGSYVSPDVAEKDDEAAMAGSDSETEAAAATTAGSSSRTEEVGKYGIVKDISKEVALFVSYLRNGISGLNYGTTFALTKLSQKVDRLVGGRSGAV